MRCIYTEVELDPTDAKSKPSREHIIPLSLGGSNQFTTFDVSEAANNRAGREIDDAVASQLPFLMLRHRYHLEGNRKTVPPVRLRGQFQNLNVDVMASIDAEGEIVFKFEDEQRTIGRGIEMVGTAERLKTLLQARLTQAKKRNLTLVTSDGTIGDMEDIEIALMLQERKLGGEFKASVRIDMVAYQCALTRLTLKVALGLGHRVLGARWSRGRALTV